MCRIFYVHVQVGSTNDFLSAVHKYADSQVCLLRLFRRRRREQFSPLSKRRLLSLDNKRSPRVRSASRGEKGDDAVGREGPVLGTTPGLANEARCSEESLAPHNKGYVPFELSSYTYI